MSEDDEIYSDDTETSDDTEVVDDHINQKKKISNKDILEYLMKFHSQFVGSVDLQVQMAETLVYVKDEVVASHQRMDNLMNKIKSVSAQISAASETSSVQEVKSSINTIVDLISEHQEREEANKLIFSLNARVKQLLNMVKGNADDIS